MPHQETKRCAHCQREYPREYFGTTKKRGKIYTKSYCPECDAKLRREISERYKARMRQRTAERRAAMAPKDGYRRCSHCKQEKPLSEFHYCGSSKSGYACRCKACTSIRNRQNYTPVKKGVFFDERLGRLIDKRDQYIRVYWSPNAINDLRRYYPDTSNQEISEILGMTECQVKRKARLLGLRKSPEYIRRISRESGMRGGIANKKRIRKLQQSQ